MPRNRRKPNADTRFIRKGIDKDRVVELHKAGLRNGEFAKEVGCSPGRVTNILKEMKEKPRYKKVDLATIDKGKIGALWRAGWPLSEIAIEMRCEKEDICAVLKAG